MLLCKSERYNQDITRCWPLTTTQWFGKPILKWLFLYHLWEPTAHYSCESPRLYRSWWLLIPLTLRVRLRAKAILSLGLSCSQFSRHFGGQVYMVRSNFKEMSCLVVKMQKMPLQETNIIIHNVCRARCVWGERHCKDIKFNHLI